MSQQPLTLPDAVSRNGAGRAPRRRRLLEIAGAAAIAATYVFLALTQPVELADGLASFSALVALGGVLLGAVLLLVAVLPVLPTSTLVLMPVAIVLNVVLGQLMGSTGLPFYLDAIGTVLIAVLAGPAAGAAAGAALIGFLAGIAARGGLFRRFYLAPVAGFVTGILAGVVSAPIAAFVYGGTAGLGTGAVVSAFRAMGDTLLAAITKQALISDPMDKAIVFTIAALLAYALPRRTTFQFAFVRRFRVLAGKPPAAPVA